MTLLAILLAATLSAGNAEFEKTAKQGAFEIAVGREKARIVAEGPAKGALAKIMMSKPEAFAKSDEAKPAAWTVYEAMLRAEYETLRKLTGERLGVESSNAKTAFSDADFAKAKEMFEVRYAEERAAACAEQAAALVGVVRPSETDFETKDEAALKKEMSAKVAVQQKTAVFEENLSFISEKIVEPVIEAAKKERKRQGEYLRRVKSDAYAPSMLAKDLTDKLVLNVKERKTKDGDMTVGWNVFPSVTNATLRNVVHQRTMDHLSAKVAEIPFEIKQGEIAKTIASARAKHWKASESRDRFRRTWTHDLCVRSVNAAREEAPKAEQKEFVEYLTKHTADDRVTKTVNKRISDEFAPQLNEIRRALADAEFANTWPTLADSTWFPDAKTADETVARSDYAVAVRAWRKMENVNLNKGPETMEESSARADKAVTAAFEIARNAIKAQMWIVNEVYPDVLAEVHEKKDSFWSRTPDFGTVVAMLTEVVERRWTTTKVGVLWPKGDAPKNADEQHIVLFPSVKKHIEMVAKSIMAEINKPEPEDAPDESELLYSIVVSRTGGRVTVKLDQGGKTLVEKNPKAKMDDFRSAMKEVGEKLGKEVLKLK